MPKKYLLLLFSLFFFGFAAPQAAPTLLLASSGADVSQYASISAPILPKKAKKRPKSKPKKHRKPNAYSALTFIYGILGIFFALWVIWGGIYIMRWIIGSMSNLATASSDDLWTGIALIFLPLLLFVPFAIMGGRYYGGKKFKIWLTFFYFLAVIAVVFAMLFFIFGLLSQIWLLLAIALGLALFGSVSLFLCNRALDSYSNGYIAQPGTPGENIEWNNNEEEEE